MSIRLRIILLAGGSSRRYNGNKLFSNHPGGEPLLQYTVKQYAPLCETPIVLVSGAYHQQISADFSHYDICHLVYNPGWQEGIASSIRNGIQYLQREGSHFSHVLIGLSDLPKVTTASLQHLTIAAQEHPQRIIASRWGGRLSAPAIFPVEYLPQLMMLSGDKGAGKLLNNPENASFCKGVEHPEAACDIDRTRDWDSINFHH
ncbi:nucleotidyltransferase family protein [Alteromonas pelagimontana]|uniref:Nucleotidyltransferase family protein n=1 Tax=Alteromonas pelagimontana TaxID=1858656 RepID=A0A6M4M834_9ALTE|nr:nucleotidyltransferase family protein [Alteromonas pelagimontana]QJR79394.1 nucleotidyltransferase family protein [Alteromonas pelagimontana]